MPFWAWAAFVIFIAGMLAFDLGVFQKKKRVVGLREAVGWSVAWVALAMIFNAVLWWWWSRDAGAEEGGRLALQWFTAYLVEICLSVDNVFVFAVIFSYFKVPPQHQHRVLFWGVLGAAVMRLAFIVAGVGLLDRFHWVIYCFGVFLVFTGVKMALPHQKDRDPGNSIMVRLFRRFFPVAEADDASGRFFVIRNGRRLATSLFIVLLVVETTDVAFALDSIPAVLAISGSVFIIFTSNIFAILGLRSLYFALQGAMGLFRYLGAGLAAILVFIGAKMLLEDVVQIPIGASLGVIGGVLAIAVGASLLAPKKNESCAADGR